MFSLFAGWIFPLIVLLTTASQINPQRKLRYRSFDKSSEKFAGDVYKVKNLLTNSNFKKHKYIINYNTVFL